jgi:hypothetical protein
VAARFSPDGKRILLKFREVVTLWNWGADTGNVRTFPSGRAIFRTSNELIFSGGSSNARPTRLKSLEDRFYDIEFSWSAKSLASSYERNILATSDGHDLYFYDSRTGQLKSILREELPEDDESGFSPQLGIH